MAVELIARPIGHKLSVTQVTAVIVDDGTGDAIVYVAGGHPLSDGDYVYIESNLEAYNGFKYVDATAYDYFKIKDSEGGTFIPYYQDQDITMYVSVLEHGWQSVHLPIAYELESDLWPENVAEEAYNPNTVDSFTSYGGNTKLNLDKALSDPTALSFIELVGTGVLAGQYQILTVLQDWEVVINLTYDATHDFSPYTIVKYYNSYHINVEVWAGLESDHRWFHVKPFELAGTLKLIPDSNGRVKFSIHEILRGYIATRNNLTLNTLPNNTDFHTGFYIKYSEGYDVSDGVEITTFTGDQTDDSGFIGHAVNSMMPFKSQGSGFMSDYLNEGSELARWLTLFARPLAIVGYFFDLSFINRYNGIDLQATIYKRALGHLIETELILIENPGSGVIRLPFTPETGFDEYCIRIDTLPLTQNSVPPLSEFFQNSSGTDSWTLGATPNYSASGDNTSNALLAPYTLLAGQTYEFTYDIDVTLTGAQVGDEIRIGSGQGLQDGTTISIPSSGNYTGTIMITPSIDRNYIGIGVTGTPSSINVDVNSLLSAAVVIPGFQITEQICIDIVQECGTTFTNDNLRITEGQQFRELES